MSKRLGAYALEPFYDEVLAELGKPPLGLPDELTFAYAWDLACQHVKRENDALEAAQETATPGRKVAPRKTPAKKAPGKRAPRKATPTVADRMDAEFGG